jgi:proteasome assembly chaperone (PAC2) family protein
MPKAPLTFQMRECQIENMSGNAIQIKHLPELESPTLIAGFEGWGNALGVSKAMVSYLIRKLKAQFFAKINPDPFYRYDDSRPLVNIEGGALRSVIPPGGSFYAVHNKSKGGDLVILKANEPNLRWLHFADELFSLCERLGVKTFISLGSMYDNVLHTDRIISGVASSKELVSKMEEKNVMPINYRGPSAIHSTLHSEGQKRGIQCISLWCHCPYYLEGTTHFGLMAHLGSLLSFLVGFTLDTEEIEASWKELNKHIQELVEKTPELDAMINELRKAKVRGSWASMKESERKGEKVIRLADFLKPR